MLSKHNAYQNIIRKILIDFYTNIKIWIEKEKNCVICEEKES